MKVTPALWLLMFALTGRAEEAAGASPDPRYIPIKGCAYRLALGDVTGDGKPELVYGAYDGAVRCINPNTGQMLWETATGGFPFGVAAADVDGDRRAEVFAACADGTLYAFSPAGKLLWTFRQNNAALYGLVVSGRAIVTGGIARQVYLLSATGQLLATHEFKTVVNHLAGADGNVLAVGYGRYAELLRVEAGAVRRLWHKRMPGEFVPYSLDAGDLDGDGHADAVMGTDNEGGCRVLATDSEFRELWLTDRWWGKLTGGLERRGMFCMTLARLADVFPAVPGPEVLTATSGSVRIFDRRGKPLGEAHARVAFNDLVADGATLYLGSTPNGDDTIYRIDLRGDWQSAINTLDRHGLARRVGENLATLRRQAAAAPAEPGASRYGPYRFKLPRYNENRRQKPGSLDWFAETFPAPNFQPFTFVGWNLREDASPEPIVSLAKTIEADRVPMFWTVDHGCTPHVSLPTLEKALKAAPTQLLGFISHEDEWPPKIRQYFPNYIGPLADICQRSDSRQIMIQEKNLWYVSMPATKPVFDALFSGRRGETFILSTDDANSRTPELNLFGRVGLRQAGLALHIQASVISDSFCYNRMREWEQPKTGSPLLRQLVAHTVLGADYFFFRDDFWQGSQPTEQAREFTDAFVPMLAKGIVFAPRPDQMAGLSRLGFAVHEPPEKWITDGHNGHGVDAWQPDAELDNAVLPHNGCIWGNTPTPAHALQAVLFHKQRQFGYFIPPTPYGPVVFAPAQADLSKVTGVEEWWHTDGISIWREGGPKLTGAEAGQALRESFEKVAAKLPFRAVGDDVFFHTVQIEPGRYRLFAIDPGWLDPADRRIRVRVQLPGSFEFADRLTGQSVLPDDVVVPAGALRILEARRR